MRHQLNHALLKPVSAHPDMDELPSRNGLSTDSYAILRLRQVLKARGRSRSTHYTDIKQGLFPRPVLLGARAVGWPEHEVAALNAARIAGMTDVEIRTLVTQLEAARKPVLR